MTKLRHFSNSKVEGRWGAFLCALLSRWYDLFRAFRTGNKKDRVNLSPVLTRSFAEPGYSSAGDINLVINFRQALEPKDRQLGAPLRGHVSLRLFRAIIQAGEMTFKR